MTYRNVEAKTLYINKRKKNGLAPEMYNLTKLIYLPVKH